MQIKLLAITLTLLTSAPILRAITVNGQDLATYGKPGEPIIYRDTTATNITLRMQSGTISIGSIAIPKMQINDLIDFYITLDKHKNSLSRTVSKHAITTRSKHNIYAHGSYMASDALIVLQTDLLIDIKDSLLKGPEVALISNTLRLEHCYISGNRLQIEPANLDSMISMIVFIFDEKAPIPAYLQGHIDFTKDETITDLVVLGAREIAIVFKEEAFNS